MILKKKHQSFIALFLLLIVVASCTARDEKDVEQASIDLSTMPSVSGENIHTLVSDSGRTAYRMKAPKLLIFDKVEEPYWDFPEGLQMITYSTTGEQEGEIESKFAIYDVKKELWELRIDVVAVNTDGTRLETDLLYWDQKKELIYSDTLVTITEEDMKTTGTGFESDETFTDWHMDNFTTELIMEN